MSNPVTSAIDLYGRVGRLAKRMGVTHQAIRKWEAQRIPAEQVIPLVVATDGLVTPHDCRPDIYPDPNWMPDMKDPAPSAGVGR